MAGKEVVSVDVNSPTIIGFDESQFVWENVKEEAPDQITFDTPDDVLIAEYKGMDRITFTDRNGEEKEFWQLRFRLPTGPAVVNGGYELVTTFKDIPEGSMTRTQLVKLVDTGQASPMKSYRVDVAQRPQ
jgi:hypothetical protein